MEELVEIFSKYLRDEKIRSRRKLNRGIQSANLPPHRQVWRGLRANPVLISAPCCVWIALATLGGSSHLFYAVCPPHLEAPHLTPSVWHGHCTNTH